MGKAGTGLNQRSTHPLRFTGEPGHGFCSFVTAAAQQIVTTAAVGSFNLPVVGLFCFDPAGARPVAYPSAMRRLRPHRRFLSRTPISTSDSSQSAAIQSGKSPVVPFRATAQPTGPASGWPWVLWSLHSQNATRVPSSPPSSTTSPSGAHPPSTSQSASVPSRTWPAFSFLATALPPGAASCWPWVPWSISNQTNFRVQNEHCWIGFLVTNLGLIVDWASLLPKEKWADKDLITSLGLLTYWATLLPKGGWSCWFIPMGQVQYYLEKHCNSKIWYFSNSTSQAHLRENKTCVLEEWLTQHYDLEDKINLKRSVMVQDKMGPSAKPKRNSRSLKPQYLNIRNIVEYMSN